MPVPTTTHWPTMADYQGAVQLPTFCFQDPELKGGTPVTDKLGLPKPICGQFASVYEIETRKSRYAVKCFLRNIPDQHDRYAEISKHISQSRSPYFVVFEYQKEGILVQGELRPLVKMAWVKGLSLNQFIERRLSDADALLDLETRWLGLLEHLQSIKIAHGDLQHGNVLVAEDDSLRLIDYDGMWVPALQNQRSHETGHPDFQSPLRTDRHFHAGIDFFAGGVIHVAIRALRREPSLWKKYNNGDNLLFRRQDFLKPSGSALIAELNRLGDDVVDERLAMLVAACSRLPGECESIKRVKGTAGRRPGKPRQQRTKRKQPKKNTKSRRAPPARPLSRSASAPTSPSWIGDHVSGYNAPQSATKAASASRSPGAQPAPKGDSTRQKPSIFRFVLHAVVLPPVAFPAVAEYVGLLSTNAEALTLAHRTVFGAAALLGCLSLASLLVGKKFHRAASGLFFGYVALLSACDVVYTVWTNASSDGSPTEYGFGAWLFALSGLGWLIRPKRFQQRAAAARVQGAK